MQLSPLAPTSFPEIKPVKGIKLGAVPAGIKYQDRLDVALFSFCEGSHVAGVFTTSKTASAAVHWSKDVVSRDDVRGCIVNSGNANAFTGVDGDSGNQTMAEIAAGVLSLDAKNIHAEQVAVASTGVIGEPLNVSAVQQVQPLLENCLGETSEHYKQAAQAIMTTDTFAKGASVTTLINGQHVTISGIAKGSGMIAPDMATMLGFVFTDANIDKTLLQTILREVSKQTFNCITVDSDTSTSDTVILAATGKANDVMATSIEECADFIKALTTLMSDLATQIVKDGEGASKFITINVKGAHSDESAKVIAMAIANSPLVKTAIAGEDANWGRVVAAIGKAGQPADRDKLIISMGGVQICANGQAVADYDETVVSEHLKGLTINIDVNLQIGSGQSRVWTCDLTERYIQINADYRS